MIELAFTYKASSAVIFIKIKELLETKMNSRKESFISIFSDNFPSLRQPGKPISMRHQWQKHAFRGCVDTGPFKSGLIPKKPKRRSITLPCFFLLVYALGFAAIFVFLFHDFTGPIDQDDMVEVQNDTLRARHPKLEYAIMMKLCEKYSQNCKKLLN